MKALTLCLLLLALAGCTCADVREYGNYRDSEQGQIDAINSKLNRLKYQQMNRDLNDAVYRGIYH